MFLRYLDRPTHPLTRALAITKLLFAIMQKGGDWEEVVDGGLLLALISNVMVQRIESLVKRLVDKMIGHALRKCLKIHHPRVHHPRLCESQVCVGFRLPSLDSDVLPEDEYGQRLPRISDSVLVSRS